jgi:hypothetical protein
MPETTSRCSASVGVGFSITVSTRYRPCRPGNRRPATAPNCASSDSRVACTPDTEHSSACAISTTCAALGLPALT